MALSPLSDPNWLDRLIAQHRIVEWAVQKLPICQLARSIGHIETPLEEHQRKTWTKIRDDYYGRQRSA